MFFVSIQGIFSIVAFATVADENGSKFDFVVRWSNNFEISKRESERKQRERERKPCTDMANAYPELGRKGGESSWVFMDAMNSWRCERKERERII